MTGNKTAQRWENEVFSFRFYYDRKSNSLYCRISKGGSTTYYYSYLKLAMKQMARRKVPTDRVIFEKTMFRFNKDNVKAVLARQPFVFAVTRHPYERLVSAYVDYQSQPWNFKKWHTRQISCQGQGASCECGSRLAWREQGAKCRKLSFLEFLTEVVLREAGDCEGVGCNGRMNVHWTPMDNHCSFCALNYSLLSSMDTFSRDHARVAGILGVKVQQKKKKEHTHIGTNINEVTREMFSNVPEHVLESINRVYKFDLEMFGNTPYPGYSS